MMRIAFSLLAILVSAQVQAQTLKPLPGWRYIPTQESFWTDVVKDLDAKSYTAVVNSALDEKEMAKEELNITEAKLALAKGFRGLGFLQSAYFIFSEVVESNPGSFASFEALRELATLIPEGSFDEESLERIINKNSWSEVPEGAIPILSYYLTTNLAARDFKTWSREPLRSLKAGNYWTQRLEYYRALELVKAGKIEEGLTVLAAIEANENSGERLQRDARLHQARLTFEKMEYEAAESMYQKLSYGARDSGQILFERAWNQYYLKDFSLAMGMLESLKSPFFSTSVDPEQYVLASLILRDLCLYPSVRATNREFFSAFGPAVEHIRRNQPLEQNYVLMSMVLTKDPYRQLADSVDSIQKEEIRLAAKFGKTRQLQFLRGRFARRQIEIKGRLSRRIDKELQSEANRLLEIADQMKLLDYISGLDENRIQQIFESREYRASEVDTLRFNRLYWPQRSVASSEVKQTKIRKEFWFGELPNLRMMLSDRCEGGKKK